MLSCNLSAEIDQNSDNVFIKSVSCTFLSVAFIVGVPGNFLVMWTIYRKLKNISVTVLLIGNLALADFLILLPLPIWIYTSAATKWAFGWAFCKILMYIIYFNLYVSIFLITLLSIERFLAVFRPFHLQRWTRQHVFQKITILIWITAALLGLVSLPFYNPNPSGQSFQCILHEFQNTTQKVIFLILETCVGFFVPFCIILTCYIFLWRKLREMKFGGRHKSDKIIIIVVGTFVICWIPYHAFNIVNIASFLLGTCTLEGILKLGRNISGGLLCMNSCLNPIFYFYYAFRMKSPTKILRLNVLFEKFGGTETEKKMSENTEDRTPDRTPLENNPMVALYHSDA
ncbi:leukotriene B4 receptor 1-like [Dendrobates tinctorius]|uniref:leukotriene B4 receptor 1-like n=1 Tax=Dendrobates tinctorius TaxID=92724 RepID=UPI003CC9F1B3